MAKFYEPKLTKEQKTALEEHLYDDTPRHIAMLHTPNSPSRAVSYIQHRKTYLKKNKKQSEEDIESVDESNSDVDMNSDNETEEDMGGHEGNISDVIDDSLLVSDSKDSDSKDGSGV